MLDEPDGLSPKTEINRRDFLAAAGASVGYALAAGPVMADAIVTDATGLHVQMISLRGVDGAEVPAYVAQPAIKGPFPVILVVQEIFGVHAYIQDICRRFAKLGYLAIAPELYVRQGDPHGITDIPTLFKTIVGNVPDTQVMSDLDVAVDWAGKNGGDLSRLGITGFCWGGRITWLYAAHSQKVRAAVAWYGRLVGDKTTLQPRHPLDMADEIKAPVLGLYGGKDESIPVATVQQMDEALARAGIEHEFHVYPDAPHAFHADYRPSYRADAAQDGWFRAVDWFKRHGVV
jgi:carboxymethylenebutenolidase